jgi:hypothetical protein
MQAARRTGRSCGQDLARIGSIEGLFTVSICSSTALWPENRGNESTQRVIGQFHVEFDQFQAEFAGFHVEISRSKAYMPVSPGFPCCYGQGYTNSGAKIARDSFDARASIAAYIRAIEVAFAALTN